MEIILRLIMVVLAIFALVSMGKKFDRSKYSLSKTGIWIKRNGWKYLSIFLLLYSVYVSFINTQINKAHDKTVNEHFTLMQELDKCKNGK